MAGPKIRRLYYSASEVSDLIGISPGLLKTWENKFPHFKPARSQSGRRLYKPSDLKLIRRIKKLKDIGYTDEKVLGLIYPSEEQTQIQPAVDIEKLDVLKTVKDELVDLLRLLREEP